jgi:hypothetical protein
MFHIKDFLSRFRFDLERIVLLFGPVDNLLFHLVGIGGQAHILGNIYSDLIVPRKWKEEKGSKLWVKPLPPNNGMEYIR